jgi:(4S)-4-hydroxy-5-phosphonooxypentane-2,3-dione isomerase
MIVTCVYVDVRADHINDFIKECIINHNESVKEPGNLRFDILQDASNPSKFILYEAYETEAASAAHKQTAHYLKWKQNVEIMMGRPRQGVKHNIICPREVDKW